MRSLPFATVAIAGHTLSGEWCACGTVGCICDPGEQSSKPVRGPSPIEHGGKAKPGRVADLDLGTGAFLLVLALFVWSRLRA
jgi:hypothetical protein